MTRKFFIRFLRGAWYKILALSLLGVASSGCGVLLALVSKRVIDAALGQTGENLLRAGMSLGIVTLAQLLLQILLAVLQVRTSSGMRFRIQGELYGELLHKEKLAASRYHSGELVNRLAGDSSVVAGGVVGILPTLLEIVSRVLFSFFALLILDPILAVLCLAGGLVVLGAAVLYRKRTGALFRESRESEGRMRSFLQETVQNLNVIKAFSVYDVVKRQLGRLQGEAFRLTLRKNRVSLGANICFYVAMNAGYYATLGWCAWQISRGVMTAGTLTAVLGLMGSVTAPFRQLASLFTQYMSTVTSAERLVELESLPVDDFPPQEPAEPLYDSMRELRLTDVSFGYGEGMVLSHISAVFPKGSITAVTGESGAGKSTLLNLITGLYRPETGTVTAATQEGETPVTGAYRGLFAYVPQEFLLLSGTVLENIALFQENPDESLAWSALRTAELEEEVRALPEGIYTQLGEGGSRLSGGQRQRMAIARALYSGAKILLMDESTSALSGAVEERLLNNLRSGTRTVIFVTHRSSAVNLCDRVLKIKDGHIYKAQS